MSIHHFHLELMGVILVPHRNNSQRTLQLLNKSLPRSAHHANVRQIQLWSWLDNYVMHREKKGNKNIGAIY